MTDGCEYQQSSGITGLVVYQHCGSPTGWSINLSLGAYNMDPVSSVMFLITNLVYLFGAILISFLYLLAGNAS
jgi:hypothetical protein